jgi:hypothetical protein
MFPSNFVEIVDEAGESPSSENADKFGECRNVDICICHI